MLLDEIRCREKLFDAIRLHHVCYDMLLKDIRYPYRCIYKFKSSTILILYKGVQIYQLIVLNHH